MITGMVGTATGVGAEAADTEVAAAKRGALNVAGALATADAPVGPGAALKTVSFAARKWACCSGGGALVRRGPLREFRLMTLSSVGDAAKGIAETGATGSSMGELGAEVDSGDVGARAAAAAAAAATVGAVVAVLVADT